MRWCAAAVGCPQFLALPGKRALVVEYANLARFDRGGAQIFACDAVLFIHIPRPTGCIMGPDAPVFWGVLIDPRQALARGIAPELAHHAGVGRAAVDRKSTRLNSSHVR